VVWEGGAVRSLPIPILYMKKGIHMKLKLILMLFLLALSLCACNTNEFLQNSMDKMAPDDDEALAKECLTALRKRDW
jgi:hypothetical protein